MRLTKTRAEIHLFETILLFVVSVSASSILLLTLNRFNSIIAVLLGSILFVLLAIVFKLKFTLVDKRFDGILLLILLVALFFRFQPYLWVMGGQDQGIYVNMSATYERTGSTFITDGVRGNIKDQKTKEYYDLNNHLNTAVRKEGQFEGNHLPGVYIKDLDNSEYVFQFYPLHPIWMAIFGRFLGAHNRVYSLVFFSLISIVAFYLLAFELSGGKKLPGYLAAGFLAVNPLHACFSKFPVSEIVFLAFSSSAFYFLIRYYKALKQSCSPGENKALAPLATLFSGENKDSSKGKVTPFYLFLSAGLMACLFFTRISGFMYIPLFYLLLLAIVLFMSRSRVARNQLILYILAVFALFTSSVLYGLRYSYPYSTEQYNLAFAPLLGNDWEKKLMLFTILAFVLLFLVSFSRNEKLHRFLQKTTIFLRSNLHLVLYTVILLGAYRAYQLANLGWRSILSSNLYVAALYISPFASLLLLFAVNYFRRKRDVLVSSLLVFLAAFGVYALVIRFTTSYHYYFARYLLSELVPYSLLLVALYLGYLLSKRKLSGRIALYLTIAIFIYFLSLTSFQLLGRGADGADTALRQVATQVGKEDLLLLLKTDSSLHEKIKVPLSYYYGLNVFSFSEVEDLSSVLQSTTAGYRDSFVLSQIPVGSDSLVLIDKVLYRVGNFRSRKVRPPTEFNYTDSTLFLYKIKKSVF